MATTVWSPWPEWLLLLLAGPPLAICRLPATHRWQITGADHIRKAQEDLEQREQAAEEAKKEQEEAKKAEQAQLPSTAAEAKALANRFFGQGKMALASAEYVRAIQLSEQESVRPDGQQVEELSAGMPNAGSSRVGRWPCDGHATAVRRM